ncbi:uncharacterized protein [Blastocystis hominis]|uniref:Uncharacterized protein n=1 Tax=Blastocystis hominis TaxID=12968 RepID=D8M5M0_BLAHO|nr:uncharacterized protein [Blastocystis hominis]CBK23359.2 unnamed protein product [Blastocystis hominis]|eukprot:XP_012897407.1 uncharacterized protein [Blastocystis hominis]
MQNKELDGLFPDDHISVYYTVLHFRAIHKTEGELVSNLSLQWSQEECFRPILEKYDSVHLILEFKENDWIQDVRAAISNHTATSALIEQYHDFQSVLITRKLQLRSEFYNVSHYSDSPIHCDGCDIPRNQKKVKAILNYQNGLLIRKFVGNEEVEYTDTPWFPSNDQKFDVTAIVTAFGYNRLFALRQFMYRYQGPIVLVIYATSTQEIHLVRYISTHFIPKRVTILFYLVSRYLKSSTVFPINRLRNLAIRNIRTTHFLILDMDLRLSLNTYKEVMSLPQFLYQSNRSAVILPVFFYIGKQILAHCSSTESCSYLSNWIQPENKLELIECINRKICISNKNNIRTHMYVMPEWFTTSKESHVSRVRCFITNFMEP